jgi:dolichol-phosphate mannosyltransferase
MPKPAKRIDIASAENAGLTGQSARRDSQRLPLLRSPVEESSFGTHVSSRIAVIIPCYRVRDHILDVMSKVGRCVLAIYVVDDKCPENTGQFVLNRNTDPRVKVIFNEVNQGVGGAVMKGITEALRDKMEIVVKIDGDGQMDPAYIPHFVMPIIEGKADFTKGNRFFYQEDLRSMPGIRLFGNAALSFLTKASTGYWNIFDPTNGYIALDSRLLEVIPLGRVDKGYFFETDLLYHAGLMRAKVLDIPMRARYAGETSNLKIHQEFFRFVGLHLRNLVSRIFYCYFLRDFNVASLELILGLMLTAFGVIYGFTHLGGEHPAVPGTVMLSALPLLVGLVLLLSFVNFDVQQVPREAVSSQLRARLADNRKAD